MSDLELKTAICDVCHCMYDKGWGAANDGNVSAMTGDGRIICTPSGISKREIIPDMLITVDIHGIIVEPASVPGLRPSSEMPMHLRCYSERTDIGAVVHAHPPMATAFAVADRPLDDYAIIEAVINLGAVPVVPYATPGTEALPDSIAPYLQRHDALLLRAHGALTVGDCLKTAYYRMESLEHVAHISILSRLLGGPRDLDRAQIDELIDRRTSFYGLSGRHPGYVKL